MNAAEPCKFCGCSETNLVDGFYYCVECGTQDTNVRETLVEFSTIGDGVLAMGTRRRITQIPKAKEVEMTDDWYKWHTLNFLLSGLADELIEIGAQPSFKTKLLWVWTRYMKKYQNKADFGLAANDDEDNSDEDNPTMNENAYSDDDEDDEIQQKNLHLMARYDVKKITMLLVISFLYVALNLDKSHIQLSHLLRLMKEGRISVVHWRKLVPKELRPNKLQKILLYNHQSFIYSYNSVRYISLSLFKKLDLGNPIVPDLRPLVDEYLQELCLPADFKPFVISLMHARSFDYLDINAQYAELLRIPSYELYVMSHIVMALKICFGLDCEYEVKLSDLVDKINDREKYPKSYNIHSIPEPTERLFNFRDWCNYLQFRKTLLRAHTLYLGAPNYFDMNDYVATEHQRDGPDYKITLKDEITANIIKKIEHEGENVIPRSEFVATLTPHTTYARVILEHTQDREVKLLLGEDFTQYSLKYITEDLFLADPDSTESRNILTGVRRENLEETKQIFYVVDPSFRFAKGMVYVKNCDNHNWTLTQRPKLEHIITNEKISDSNEKENDHGYESNSEVIENSQKFNSIVDMDNHEDKNRSATTLNSNNKAHDDLITVTDIEMEVMNEQQHDDKSFINNHTNIESVISHEQSDIENILKIKEENDGSCIFDDDFLDLDTKKEEMEPELEPNICEQPSEVIQSFIPDTILRHDVSTQDYYAGDKDSDVSSVDSVCITPDSLNRNDAIKELIIHACQKYKISIPGKYIHRTKKTIIQRPKKCFKVNKPSFKGETTLKINGLIAAYQSHIQQDILNQMSTMVQSAIANFNENDHEDNSEPPEEFQEPLHDNDDNDATIAEIDNTEDPENNEIVNDEYKLFGDSSDGETYAEELLPKKNPKYDEKTHDISQLYIKPTENSDSPVMELNPKLLKIVVEKMEADKKDPRLLDGSPEPVKERSDSEEEVPLSLLQEQRQIREQLKMQEKMTTERTLNPLIKNEDIPSYNYWLRHYKNEITKSVMLNQRFANEMDANLPESFAFVLKECADVVGYPPFNLYKGLQNIEDFLRHKYLKRKKLTQRYIEKEKAKRCRET